ncbi:hypothetical protein [Desulfosporosinus sp. BG]|uniref:hypothetical protein n=1 Tax=Desulfosporosinus sp. BG TaxID=1633135 RepID=UPI00083ADE4C|nr:hypothetical protein [Desulfosporosinus sp. BG]ODA40889.1 hypothetical protein DSBG_2330 [Desulfosporosinus sp. BG]
MKFRRRYGLGIIIITVLLFFLPKHTLADEIITQVGGYPITVLNGHSVETVLSVGTDARIAGNVTDAVLVINGNVYLEPTAQVDLVIDLGGHVYNSALKNPKTGVFEVNFSEKLLNESLLGGVILLGIWALRVVVSLLGIVFLTGLGYCMRNRLSSSENLLSAAFLRLFGIGTAFLMLLVSLAVLLTLTVFGIPLAALLIILGIVLAVLGLIPVMQFIGTKVLSSRILEYPAITRCLAQSTLFVALVSLPLIGLVFLIVMGLTGLGLALTMGWRHYKRRKRLKLDVTSG